MPLAAGAVAPEAGEFAGAVSSVPAGTEGAFVSTFGAAGAVLPGTYVAFFGDPATYGATLRFNF